MKNIKNNRGEVSSALILILAVLGAGALALTVLVGSYFSYSNNEVRLRNAITAKQRDNQSQLDNMQKKIIQAAQITQAQAADVAKLVRTAPEGALLTAVHEAIPNLDQTTFRQMMNIVVSSRDSWTENQREILDLKREHDNARTVAPSSWVCGGRPEIQVVIVTSDRAEDNFRTGKDNDTSVFGK